MGETVDHPRVENGPAMPLARPSRGRPVSLRPPVPKPHAVSQIALAFSKAIEGRRLIVLVPFALIVGQVASLLATTATPAWLLAAVGGALLLAMVALRRSLRATRGLTLTLAFWIGFALFSLHGALSATPMLVRPAFGTFEARVDEILSEGQSESRIVVSAVSGTAERPAPDIRRARLFVQGAPALSPGDRIRAPMRLTPVPGPVVPGGFDSQFHAFFDGIGAYGNTTKPPEILTAGETAAPERLISNLRHEIARRIDAVLQPPAAGIARALINGDQSGIGDAEREVMATAGIAHVYSVSGLHLSIVAGGAYAIVRLLLALIGSLAARFPIKPVAAAAGIVAACGYFAISGGNVAALRSTIMIMLVMGAVIAGRRALTMRNVAIAGTLIILLDPASVFRPSFQLSFSAVIALIGTYEMIRGLTLPAWLPRGWVVRLLVGIVVTSLVAGAATLVFSAYHFQQTSPLGVFGNLAALPLVSAVTMPMAVLGTLAMPFGLEYWPLVAMGWSIDRMLDLAALVAGWSAGLTASPLLTPLALLIALAALAWFAFLSDWRRLILPALAVPLVLAFALDRPPDVLVSDTTQAVALREGQRLLLVAGKAGSFAPNVWSETYAMPIAAPGEALRCDTLGCIATGTGGFSIALVKKAEALDEDCASADLVILRQLRAPDHCAAPIIDAAGLRRFGMQWLRFDDKGRLVERRQAIPDPDRPWRPAASGPE